MGQRESSLTHSDAVYIIHHSDVCVGKRHADTLLFDDKTFLPAGYHRVYEVRVWHSDLVHGIQFMYIDGSNTIHAGPFHGQPVEQLEHDGAIRDDITLATNEGEYIAGMAGRAGDLVDHLTITTSSRVMQFGASPGGNPFTIPIPPDCHIVGVYGGYGGHLHQFGVCYQHMGEYAQHHAQHAQLPNITPQPQPQQQPPPPRQQQQQHQAQPAAQPMMPTATIGPCPRQLRCGHECGGVRGESIEECFCWHEECRDACDQPLVSTRQLACDPCLICLSELGTAPCLRLTSCHHIFHHSCLYSMIIQGSSSFQTSRMTWGHLHCPLCPTTRLEHSSLARAMTSATAWYDEYVRAVTTLTQQHALHRHDKVVNPTSPYYGKPLAFAMDHFAMYLCSKCHQPYCGGTRDCEADMAQDERRDILVCESCTDASDCKFPEHRSACLWKCRYCCSEAVYYCFGSIHVCKACHDTQFEARRLGKATGQAQRASCPPPGHTKCPLGLLPSQHKNGITPDCELIIRCTICSDPAARQQAQRELTVLRSPNLVVNGSGALGLRGWRATRDWTVEMAQNEPPMGATHCFVNSFQWTTMTQTVDLRQCGEQLGFSPAQASQTLSLLLDSASRAPLEVFSYFCGRSDCGSLYELRVSLLSARGLVLHEWSSGRLAAEACTWNRVGTVLTQYPQGVRAIRITHAGQAAKFWSGPYGPKITATTLILQLPPS